MLKNLICALVLRTLTLVLLTKIWSLPPIPNVLFKTDRVMLVLSLMVKLKNFTVMFERLNVLLVKKVIVLALVRIQLVLFLNRFSVNVLFWGALNPVRVRTDTA